MIHVRPATLDDIADMIALLEDSPEAACWNAPQLGAYIESENRLCLVAEVDEKFAGLVAAQLIAGEAELENIAVANALRRRGVARALVNALTSAISVVHLEVRTSNGPAIAAYLSLGFVQVGTRKDYYSHPTCDAVLMTRS